MTIMQAFILGMIQGLTEFLPISSSAHLALVPWLFGWTDPGLAFDAFLHLGTLAAVVFYFFFDLVKILQAGIASIIERRIGYDRDRQIFWLIGIGSIPAGLLGFFFHDVFEHVFRDPVLIAIPLAGVGFFMYWVDGSYPGTRDIDQVETKDAIWIGIAQACALIPGVSRSGATITMGRLLGFTRVTAARFSFLLSVPITAAAALFAVKKLFGHGTIDVPQACLIVGLASSLFFGFLSIHFLMQLIRFVDLRYFAWYRLMLAAFIVFWSIFKH